MKKAIFLMLILYFSLLDTVLFSQSKNVIPLRLNNFLINDFNKGIADDNAKPDLKPLNKRTYSRGKALILSLILPGAGEYYLGYKKTGVGFMLAELGLWSGYLWTGHKYNNTVRDYKNYAYLYAGVDPDGTYSNEFWRAVGIYDNIYENNEGQLINRNLDGVFDENQYFWDWIGDEYRFQYNRFRIRATDLKNLKNSLVLTFFVNRIISLIDVVRLTNKIKKQEAAISVRYQNVNGEPALVVNITRIF